MKLHIRNIKSGKTSREGVGNADCEKSFLKITKDDIKPFPQKAGSYSRSKEHASTRSRDLTTTPAP